MARVMEFERGEERKPDRLPPNHKGYDIESRNTWDEIVRYIKVKSEGDDWTEFGVGMTDKQFESGMEHKEKFWLYVVERADRDDCQTHRIQNPAERVDTFLFDEAWRALGEGEDAGSEG